jgi:hypothetical protein
MTGGLKLEKATPHWVHNHPAPEERNAGTEVPGEQGRRSRVNRRIREIVRMLFKTNKSVEPLCCCHLPLSLEAFTAKHWPSLGRSEGDGGVFAALRTGGSSFYLGWALSGGRRRSQYRNPVHLAGFAALGLVLELFVVKEKLLAGCKHEVCATVDALQHLVLEFH